MPHVYYFVILDCTGNLNKSLGEPRVLSEITLYNLIDGKTTHFSFEMYGMLKLNLVLLTVLGAMVFLLYRNYCSEYRKTERWLSPHPIMILSSGLQVISVFLTVINLWTFSYDGEGYIAIDLIAKILDGLSETCMSVLLIQMASGWTI